MRYHDGGSVLVEMKGAGDSGSCSGMAKKLEKSVVLLKSGSGSAIFFFFFSSSS